MRSQDRNSEIYSEKKHTPSLQWNNCHLFMWQYLSN